MGKRRGDIPFRPNDFEINFDPYSYGRGQRFSLNEDDAINSDRYGQWILII